MNDREQFEAWRKKEHINGWTDFDIWKAATEAARATPAQPEPEAVTVIGALRRAMDNAQVPDEFRAALVGYFSNEWNRLLQRSPSPASDVSAPSPSSVGDAIRAMPLPEPRDMDYVRWGYDADDMRALLSEAAALADRQGQQPYGYVYECCQPGTDGKGWEEFFNITAPTPQKGIRNIRPLFAPSSIEDGQKSEADRGD